MVCIIYCTHVHHLAHTCHVLLLSLSVTMYTMLWDDHNWTPLYRRILQSSATATVPRLPILPRPHHICGGGTMTKPIFALMAIYMCSTIKKRAEHDAW